MPVFIYTGEDSEGEKITETVTAEDRFAVYEIARTAGHKITSVKAADTGFKKMFNFDKLNYLINRVSADELVMMTRNLGSMLKAGLTITRALSVIERQSTNPKLKGVIKKVVADINSGEQFGSALKEFPDVFNNLYVAMIKAGEEGGSLGETLQTLAIQMERSSSLTKKIKGAMIYPAIVMIVMLVIAVLMMIFVLPQITDVFKGMNKELPATTQFIIDATDFFANYTVIVIGGMIGIFFGILSFFKTDVGRMIVSYVVTRLPVIGTMAKETNSARTARTLSSLLESGVDVIQAIEITGEVVQNVFYKKVLKEAMARVEKGGPLSEVFIENTHLYPILVGEMILVGEETGSISGMLKELANFYEVEVERKTKDLSTIIEPILMVVIGAGVGFFALAMIAPIYSISDGLN